MSIKLVNWLAKHLVTLSATVSTTLLFTEIENCLCSFITSYVNSFLILEMKDGKKTSHGYRHESDHFQAKIESRMHELDGPELLQFAMMFVQGALKKSRVCLQEETPNFFLSCNFSRSSSNGSGSGSIFVESEF